jgi:hypothetical protein
LLLLPVVESAFAAAHDCELLSALLEGAAAERLLVLLSLLLV